MAGLFNHYLGAFFNKISMFICFSHSNACFTKRKQPFFLFKKLSDFRESLIMQFLIRYPCGPISILFLVISFF